MLAVWVLGLGCGPDGTQAPSTLSEADPIEASNEETSPSTTSSSTTTTAGPECEADLANDPANCGACGVGCLGGACFDGQCERVPLLPEGGEWYDVYVDRSTVLGCGDTLASQEIAPDGLGPAQTLGVASACGGRSSEAGVARTHLDLNRIDVSTWDGRNRSYSAPTGYVTGTTGAMWRDGEACFQWVDYPSIADREIQCLDPDTGAVRTWAPFDGHDLVPTELYDGGGRNWILYGDTLHEVLADGSIVAGIEVEEEILALDADDVWTVVETLPGGGGLRLTRTPLDGGSAVEVAPVQYEPWAGFDAGSIALTDDFVFFMDGDHRVKRAPRDGVGAAQTVLELSEDAARIREIAVVPGALVFLDDEARSQNLWAVGIDTAP
jgi:hypothetical protein